MTAEKRWPLVSNLVTAILCLGMLAAANLIYSHQTEARLLRNDQQWCRTYAILLRPPDPVHPQSGGLPANSILRTALTAQQRQANCPNGQ